MAGNIFVSYRRDDSKHAAGRLVDRLHAEFDEGQIFLDVDNIELGLDFIEVINDRVAACDIMLVVIGPSWLPATDTNSRQRLDDPNDFVRLEVEAALNRNIRVIPVLVDGADPPRAQDLPESLAALANRQATRLSHESFTSDANALTAALSRIVGRNSDDHATDPAKPDSTNSRQFEKAPEPPRETTGFAEAQTSNSELKSKAINSEPKSKKGEPSHSRRWDLFGLSAALSPGIFLVAEILMLNAGWISFSDIQWIYGASDDQNGFLAPFLAGTALIAIRFALRRPYSILTKILTPLSLATMAIVYIVITVG